MKKETVEYSYYHINNGGVDFRVNKERFEEDGEAKFHLHLVVGVSNMGMECSSSIPLIDKAHIDTMIEVLTEAKKAMGSEEFYELTYLKDTPETSKKLNKEI